MIPKLLVSVRDEVEAAAAIAGGADIVDVKDPEAGPLGLAETPVIQAIQQTLKQSGSRASFSVALGELTEWQAPTQRQRTLVTWASRNTGHAYLKAGPSQQSGRDQLMHSWTRLQECFGSPGPSGDMAGGHEFVAVSYADSQRSRSPDPWQVVSAASEMGCRVLLIDTWQKDALRLTDWLPIPDLLELRRQCTEFGIQLALAGRVNELMLTDLAGVSPDIIGVRGAVCSGGDRQQHLEAGLVARFSDAIRRTFGSAAI